MSGQDANNGWGRLGTGSKALDGAFLGEDLNLIDGELLLVDPDFLHQSFEFAPVVGARSRNAQGKGRNSTGLKPAVVLRPSGNFHSIQVEGHLASVDQCKVIPSVVDDPCIDPHGGVGGSRPRVGVNLDEGALSPDL